MLPVADARRIILERCQPLPPLTVPLARAGQVLAEDIVADLDSPAFTKALMDGYAARAADLPAAALSVIEEVTAGRVPTRPVGPGQATRIMTGAPLPDGADVVVPVELCRGAGDRVELAASLKPGANVLPRAQEMKRGEVILPAGAVLTPQAIGVAATCGRASVRVTPAPRVAVAATGDELIDPERAPGPGQVRNSNAPMLLAQAANAGATPRDLGIARDTAASLRAAIHEGLRASEVLILSGGVSAGQLDLVPAALRDEGVTAHFHKVHLKPGKPLFFGTAAVEGHARLVFGLPGNPVSSFVCFELFVRPAIRRLGGHARLDLPSVGAALTEDFAHHGDRPTYHPAALSLSETGWAARPLPWFGSADLRAFLAADALLVLPPGERGYRAGERVEALRLGP